MGVGSFFERIGRVAEHVAIPIAQVALPVALPGPVGAAGSHVLQMIGAAHEDQRPKTQLLIGAEETMNPLEAFAVTIILSVLQQTVKNPAHSAAVRSQLLGLADDIYSAYGQESPAPAK